MLTKTELAELLNKHKVQRGGISTSFGHVADEILEAARGSA